MWAQSSSVQLWSNHVPKKPLYYVDLTIKDSYPNEKRFVEIVAHEMVHAYQYQFYDEMTHGQTFWEWKEMLAAHDINLCDSYGPALSKSGTTGRKTLPNF